MADDKKILDQINLSDVITRRDPIPEEVMDSSGWFFTETMTVQVGEAVGRPSKEVQLSRDFVGYLLANGWYISSFTGGQENGKWDSEATTSVTTRSGSTSNVNSDGESTPSGEKTLTHHKINGGTETNVAQTPSEVKSHSNGTLETNGNSTSTSTSIGDPYWYAYNTVTLKRRRMQAELVLKDMIESFTKAYNEGREINNARYEELIACYKIMLANTENEANAAYSSMDAESFKELADRVTATVESAMQDYSDAVKDIPANWMSSRTTEINEKFDALISQAEQNLITTGLYNATVWLSTRAGIEKDRQDALTKLSDEMVTLKVDVFGRIATMKADISQKIIDASTRILDAQKQMLIGPTEIRNTVFKWMLDFMERREDDYPSLESLVTIADKLGYADGAPMEN